ncbi:glycosyltransferase family 4 protein [Tulasnella calospora MUT 4182]|uniref:Alpha-1,3/1,6-mannosyltransferase ALG2 n=1 Tax=Tulasnella calospora MUT 4182 TaxID=1051891 RepID=A0A0C3PXU5_9AGAM|nr:glycosyltransferase family 4 protein [Tulasnella calospora MUT 4182]
MTSKEGSKGLRIGIIHPDLGIGGAERLVVDAALGLQELGHSVEIITSHHDPSHSFEETNDGSLSVVHIPSRVPRSLFGALHIYLAIFRQLHLLSVLLYRLYYKVEPEGWHDVYIVDQLSACVPPLRWLTGKRVVFYVHFPDKLLATGKEATLADHTAPKTLKGLLKMLYRLPADWIEEKTTGYADVLLANSRFTAQVFKRSFRSISRSPEVVYPGINLDAYDAPAPSLDALEPTLIGSGRKTLLSLNRFERKKNTALAIEAFAELKQRGKPATNKSVRLVIGGGYDPRVQDNIDTLQHLISICNRHSLSYDILPNQTTPPPPRPPSPPALESIDILFILNFTTAQRQYLLRSPTTICLLYTPGNEHFGIGPVEGMACGLPAVACTSGGPTESLVDISANQSEGVAWLRDPDPLLWANALQEVLALSSSDREALAVRAKKRARDLFGMEQMAKGFEAALYRATDMGPVGDAPFRIKNLRMAMALLVMILWLKMNGMDLLGGPTALIFILMIAMMSLRRSP